MFLSTFDKQLDGKRRIVIPADYRLHAASDFDGVYCFPSIEADCIEGGGQALFDRYRAIIDQRPPGDDIRSSIETSFFGSLSRLSFDGAGRITLPETLCDLFGLTDWVSVVGLGDRFQIWPREAFQARRAQQREMARQGMVETARADWAARTGRTP